MANPLRDHTRTGLVWARRCTHDLLNGFPEDRATFRPTETDVHATWILGHIALSDVWILRMFEPDGRYAAAFPDAWAKDNLFGYQSTIREPDAYPAFGEVRRVLDETRGVLLAWLDDTDDARLTGPLDDGGIDFAKSPLEALAKEVWHEGWHAGQLSAIRRAAGLGPAF